MSGVLGLAALEHAAEDAAHILRVQPDAELLGGANGSWAYQKAVLKGAELRNAENSGTGSRCRHPDGRFGASDHGRYRQAEHAQ